MKLRNASLDEIFEHVRYLLEQKGDRATLGVVNQIYEGFRESALKLVEMAEDVDAKVS